MNKLTLDQKLGLLLLSVRLGAIDPEMASVIARIVEDPAAGTDSLHTLLCTRGDFDRADDVREIVTRMGYA